MAGDERRVALEEKHQSAEEARRRNEQSFISREMCIQEIQERNAIGRALGSIVLNIECGKPPSSNEEA